MTYLKITPIFDATSVEEVEDEIIFEKGRVEIKRRDGTFAFEMDDAEFPNTWSKQAKNITADKYFRHVNGIRETSLKQVVRRITKTLKKWGIEQDYFTKEDGNVFEANIAFMLYHQVAAFNSPVFFNLGIPGVRQQISACFINGIEDNLDSITDLVKTQTVLFRGGSGSGTNYSSIRGKGEKLSNGGAASGPVSFMKGLDSFAGIIKSGGTTRRAARMGILDVDHPDVEELIECKTIEEKKAQALVAAGYNSEYDDEGGAYGSVAHQNGNYSVMVNDDFMNACKNGENFELLGRVDSSVNKVVKADNILNNIAKNAHFTGDPGILFHDAINKMHTTIHESLIKSTNPCGEYMDVDDSACNLASINLGYFSSKSGTTWFNTGLFVECVYYMSLAQEVMVSKGEYPTDKIAETSRRFRQLGTGHTNLGGVLMSFGIPYNSQEGRDFAASVTSLMTSTVYRMSQNVAKVKGVCEVYNEENFNNVFKQHLKSTKEFYSNHSKWKDIWKVALTNWKNIVENPKVRNSKATVMAPTGTISFYMDSATTGLEPEMSLIKYKNLVGGGKIKIANPLVNNALITLGYNEKKRGLILKHLEDEGTIEGCETLNQEDLSVFDCAYGAGRIISVYGHILMMASIQPFISGGMSKTVSMPHDSTVEDIKEVYINAHELGLKGISIYRDGCKISQPLTFKKADDTPDDKAEAKWPASKPLPATVNSHRHAFKLGNQKMFLHIGFYPDGSVGEFFIRAAKGGSTINGLLDSFAVAASLGIQHGLPLEKLINKLSYVSFEPSGFSGNNKIGFARSPVDYIVRYLSQFIDNKNSASIEELLIEKEVIDSVKEPNFYEDTPMCSVCGAPTKPSGSCFVCIQCGETTGCS